jgi:hypothetical protein
VIRRTALVAAILASLTLAPAALAAHHGGSSIGIEVFGSGPGIPFAAESRLIPARVTGDLVVSFHGDRAAGCQRRGVCADSGTIVWTPTHPASLEVDGFTSSEGKSFSFDLGIDQENFASSGGGTTDTDVQEAGAVCADAANTGSDLSFPTSRKGVHIVLTGDGLFVTRCAGPLESDLAKALPSTWLPVRRLVRGNTTIGLRSERRFASHGFAGTVASTLSVSLKAPGRWQRTRLKVSKLRQHEVRLSYRATLAGQLTADVSGDADQGLCGPLGACGLSGTLSLAVPATGEAEFTAYGSMKYSYAQLLRALLRRRTLKGVAVSGYMQWDRGAHAVATMRGPSGACHDSISIEGVDAIVSIGRRQLASQIGVDAEADNGLRTRCPGPFLSQYLVASGHASRAIIGRQTATMPITSGTTFSDDGYHGRFVSTLSVRLSHPTIKRRTLTEISASG